MHAHANIITPSKGVDTLRRVDLACLPTYPNMAVHTAPVVSLNQSLEQSFEQRTLVQLPKHDIFLRQMVAVRQTGSGGPQFQTMSAVSCFSRDT